MLALEKENPGQGKTGAARVNRQVVNRNYSRFFLKNQVLSWVFGVGLDYV
jgi:hypothetical protein